MSRWRDHPNLSAFLVLGLAVALSIGLTLQRATTLANRVERQHQKLCEDTNQMLASVSAAVTVIMVESGLPDDVFVPLFDAVEPQDC